MRGWAFLISVSVFITILCLDVWVFWQGALVLGILLCIGTLLVFAAGIIWQIYHDDRRLHFRRGWLLISLIAFGYAMTEVLEKSSVELLPTPENLEEVGLLIMTKFQVGLWIVSIALLLSFVLAGSLMMRRRA